MVSSPGLAADEAFTYLGVRASLVCKNRRRHAAPCLTEEKQHIFAVTRDLISKAQRHKYLLCQMVPAMHTWSPPLASGTLPRWFHGGMPSSTRCTRYGCRFKSGLEAAPWLRIGTPHVPQQVWWLPDSATQGDPGAGAGKAH